MKKIKTLLIILSWQIIGFTATLLISLPVGDFHHFVHELMLCLTFTNLVGLSGLLLYGFYQKVLQCSRLSKFLQIGIPILLMILAIALALRISMNFGGFICGLDEYQVNRWHLSILVVDFTLLVVLSIIAILLALYKRLATRLETKIRENEKLQRLQIESKLLLLQSKINPHFLFNTLNTMLDVLRRDAKQVEKIILNLSDIYRKTLMMPENELVTLKEEITLVEEYLEIEKIRMGNRLQFSFKVDEKLDEFKLPPMIIQILVENAIKHGLTPKKEGGEVKVHASRQGGTVTLEVLDNGIGMDPSKAAHGFGLVSIRQRLELMYKSAKMEISALSSGGTHVRIVLPYAA
jgi:sensor histidine kinase YesM